MVISKNKRTLISKKQQKFAHYIIHPKIKVKNYKTYDSPTYFGTISEQISKIIFTFVLRHSRNVHIICLMGNRVQLY